MGRWLVAGEERQRILTWEQVYALDRAPERLVVVGSGVTGAEFACAYQALGSEVVLVSSREHVLPGEDPDAARVLEDVFRRHGMEVLSRSRASAVRRTADGVLVTLADGRTVIADDAYLTESMMDPLAKVHRGFQPIMPTFQGLVSEEGLLQLIEYIKSLKAPQGQVVPAKEEK